MGNVAGHRRVTRPAIANATNAAAAHRSTSARSPRRAANVPVSIKTRPYSTARSHSDNARDGASDHAAEQRIQTAKAANAPEASARAGLKPEKGRGAVVIRPATSVSARTSATTPTVPGKNPPAWKPSHAVASPGTVTCQRRSASRAWAAGRGELKLGT